MLWKSYPISLVCEKTEQVDPGQKVKGRFKYVDIASVDRLSKTIVNVKDLDNGEAPSRARKEIKAGDVLISTVRPNLNTVAIVPENLDGQIASTGFCVLRPIKKVVLGKYIFYKAQTPAFINYLVQNVKGAHYPAVTDTVIKDMQLPLPPFSEQCRIVEILEEAYLLRRKRIDADVKAERTLLSIFHKMFGDPLQMLNSPEAVSFKKLGIELQNGFACGEKDVDGGVPHLRMNNIDDKGLLNLDLVRTVPMEMNQERYQLRDGDVLFMATNSADNVGKACYFSRPWNSDFLFSNHLTRIRVTDPRVSAEYLAAFLHILWTNRFYLTLAKRWVNQATVSNDVLKDISVLIPSKHKLKAFSDSFQIMLKMQIKRAESAVQINRLFEIISQYAFSGELTAKWREAHMTELLVEMKEQERLLRKAAERN